MGTCSTNDVILKVFLVNFGANITSVIWRWSLKVLSFFYLFFYLFNYVLRLTSYWSTLGFNCPLKYQKLSRFLIFSGRIKRGPLASHWLYHFYHSLIIGDLRRHYKQHHGLVHSLLECNMCHKVFATEKGLMMHKKHHEPERTAVFTEM